jgi:hypothetical protein
VQLYQNLINVPNKDLNNPNVTCNQHVCGCQKIKIDLTLLSGSTVANLTEVENCFNYSSNLHVTHPFNDTYDLGFWYTNPFNVQVPSTIINDIPNSNVFFEDLPINNNSKAKKKNGISKGNKRGLLQTITCADFEVIREGNKIKVSTFVTDKYFFIWYFRSSSGSLMSEGGDTEFELDNNLFTQTATLTLDLYHNKIYLCSFVFEVDKQDYCTIIDCKFICWEYFTHYLCYSLTAQIFIGFGAVTSFLLLFILILWCFYKCSLCLCCAPMWMALGEWRTSQVLNNEPCCIWCATYQIPPSETNEEIELETETSSSSSSEIVVVQQERIIKRPKHRTGEIYPMTLALLLLLCISSSKAECISNTVLSSNIIQCANIGSIKECNLVINTQVIFPTLGSEACITFVDPVSNIVIGNMTLKYEQMIRRATMKFQYWTIDYDFDAISQMFCPTTNDLCEDGSCSCITLQEKSHVTGDFYNYPGWTVCDSVPGCAGNGCVFCSQAEVLGRIIMRTKGVPYYVNEIIGISPYPQISYDIWVGDTNLYSSVYLNENNYYTNDNITIQLIGEITNPLNIEFGDLKIIGNSTNIFLGYANSFQEPSFGAIGDIQSQFHSWLETPPFYASYPQQPPFYSLSENTVRVLDSESGIRKNLKNYLEFPLIYGGVLWEANPNQLTGIDSNPGAVQIFLTTPDSLKMQFTQTFVCPVLIDFSYSGCFSCFNGASLNILAKSSCDSGSVLLLLTTSNRVSYYQSSIYLQTISTNFTIPIFSLDKNLEITVTLSYKSQSVNLTKAGILDNPPKIQVNDINFTGSTSAPDPSNLSFSDWWNSLTGPLNIAKWLVSVFLGIFGLVLLISFILMLIKGIQVIYTNSYHLIKL